MVSRRIGWLLLLAVAWPAQAQDMDHQLAEARSVFLRGVDGDSHAVRDALQRFRSLSQRYPREPVFAAYLGACMALQGRDADNNIEKGRITEKGLHEIDQALAMLRASPDRSSSRYLDTLLVAADTFIHIPAFFNRYNEGKRLVGEILAHPAFGGMAAEFKAAAYVAAALVAHGKGDDEAYRRYLGQAVSTDPKGRNGRFARKLLDER